MHGNEKLFLPPSIAHPECLLGDRFRVKKYSVRLRFEPASDTESGPILWFPHMPVHIIYNKFTSVKWSVGLA